MYSLLNFEFKSFDAINRVNYKKTKVESDNQKIISIFKFDEFTGQ